MNKLTVLYVLALSLVALLTIAGQLLIQWQLQWQLGDSRVVNIAGRQRMLSQKICKEILAWQAADKRRVKQSRLAKLRKSLELWQQSHEGLQHGDAELGLANANSPQLTKMFLSLQYDYQAMLANCTEFLEMVEEGNTEDNQNLVQQTISSILDLEDDYLSGMDAIVFQYDREAAERVRHLRTIESVLLISTLVVLLAEGLFIFRPAATRIRRTVAALQQTSRELLDAKKAAETANEHKSAFLANVSHDLRTPMNGIIGLTELAQTTEDRSKRQYYLTNLSESAESLLLLLNDLIELSRIEAGRIELRPSPVETRRFVSRIEAMLQQQAEAKDLAFHLEVAPAVPEYIHVDELKLQRVLVNLLNNAIKFTNAGEVRLKVSTVSVANEKRLEFEVSDTGIGIAKEDQESVFESFTQLNNTTHRTTGGAGLGLAICHRLIQEFGGRIEIESELNVGSTFRFSIPLVECEASPPGASSDRDSHRMFSFGERQLPGCNVLVVEDTAVNQLVLVEILKHTGCEVTLSESGTDALLQLENGNFDIVLMDVQLPDIDGIELTKRIRQRESELNTKALPIIALTAHAMDEDRQKCLGAGMNAYLSKPIRTKLLLSAMTELLDSDKTLHGCVTPIDERTEQEPQWTLASAESEILERLCGRREVLEELISLTLVELPKGMEELEKAVAVAELPRAAVVIHRVKGMVANLAASRAEALAQRIEDACKAENTVLIKESLCLLEDEVDTLCREMSASARSASSSQLTGSSSCHGMA